MLPQPGELELSITVCQINSEGKERTLLGHDFFHSLRDSLSLLSSLAFISLTIQQPRQERNCLTKVSLTRVYDFC